MSKVAVITGGASGIGLYVATGLSQRQSENWSIHIIDLDGTRGPSTAASINATFHQCDITNYDPLAAIFKSIYQQHRRIDFVFANAGILEGNMFFQDNTLEGDEPPPPPDTRVLDINLNAVVTTSWLGLHYFQLTRKTLADDAWEGNLVMTASVAGIYAAYTRPLYTAAKYGIIGLVRSLAPEAYHNHHIRVNCICPGPVLTGMTANLGFPAAVMTPNEKVVNAVLMLIDGKAATDSTGVTVQDGKVFGRAVEVMRDAWHWKDKPPYPDKFMGMAVNDIWMGDGR